MNRAVTAGNVKVRVCVWVCVCVCACVVERGGEGCGEIGGVVSCSWQGYIAVVGVPRYDSLCFLLYCSQNRPRIPPTPQTLFSQPSYLPLLLQGCGQFVPVIQALLAGVGKTTGRVYPAQELHHQASNFTGAVLPPVCLPASN